MVKNVIVYLLNHDFEGLILVTSTIVMEVKVEEFHFFLPWTLVDMAHVLCGDQDFSWCLEAEKVDAVDWSVGINNLVEMETKSFLRHLSVPSKNNILRDATSLSPEDWN